MAKKGTPKKQIETKKKASADKLLGPFFQPFASLAKKAGKKGKKGSAKDTHKDTHKDAHKHAPSEPSKKTEPLQTPPPEQAVVETSEAETFAMFMAGVRPLSPKAASRADKPEQAKTEKPAPKSPQPDPDAEARAALHSLVSEGYRFEVTDDGSRIEGRRLDIDPRELRRLRRGAYTIDGRLDLHGMTAAEARRAVETFIRKKRADGDRVVSLIVGRGNHSPRGIGVLRGEIAAWLSQGASARHVAAFASAPEDEGGAGAVIALLAR